MFLIVAPCAFMLLKRVVEHIIVSKAVEIIFALTKFNRKSPFFSLYKAKKKGGN